MAAAAEQRLATVTVELHSIYHHAPNTLIAEPEGKWVSQLLSGGKVWRAGGRHQFRVARANFGCLIRRLRSRPRHATKRKTCRAANPLAREGQRTKHLGSITQGSRFLAA